MEKVSRAVTLRRDRAASAGRKGTSSTAEGGEETWGQGSLPGLRGVSPMKGPDQL